MYLMHFGLQRKPFPSTPDSSCYYPASGHEQILARLQHALAEGEAMTLLMGEAGTGKTLLGHCLLERFPAGTTTAFLTNSHIGTRKDLLQAILFDLSQPYEGGTEQELRLRLTDLLLKNFAAGSKTLLVADEAHYLSLEALEELRLLCNLEAGAGKAVQVVLLAQPGIQRMLSRPELASLRQRLAVRTRLSGLIVDEAVDYLLHHLRAAGGRPEHIFDEEALEMLARGTRGIPRLLNQAGHQALSLAFELQTEMVDAEVALEVLSDLGLEDAEAVEDLPLGKLVPNGAGEGNGKNGNSANQTLAGKSRSATLETPAAGEEIEIGEDTQDVLAYRLFDPPRKPA